jgi:hypothetical protein
VLRARSGTNSGASGEKPWEKEKLEREEEEEKREGGGGVAMKRNVDHSETAVFINASLTVRAHFATPALSPARVD